MNTVNAFTVSAIAFAIDVAVRSATVWNQRHRVTRLGDIDLAAPDRNRRRRR